MTVDKDIIKALKRCGGGGYSATQIENSMRQIHGHSHTATAKAIRDLVATGVLESEDICGFSESWGDWDETLYYLKT